MMFAPGDLVVCVEGDCGAHEGEPSTGFLVVRRVYRVEDVLDGPLERCVGGLILVQDHTEDRWRGFCVDRFRKINPLADLDTRAAHETFPLPAKPVLDPARHSRELAK